jgi:CubicO group peptidase (beta-lactamase class C family)
MISRRDTLLGLSGLSTLAVFPGGCSGPRVTTPGQGFILKQGGETVLSELSGYAQGGAFTAERPFRVASITKAFVAELVRALKRNGGVTGQEDATLIDERLRHPEFTDIAITLDMLIQHRSGLRDPEVYWMAAPGDIRDLIVPEIFEVRSKPGDAFRYSNFNYGLAATLIEIVTGERIDELFRDLVATPLGLDIGLNWSGVSAARRQAGMPLFRGADGAWEVQVDDTDMLSDPLNALLHEDGWTLDDYRPGQNGTLFSPQGGLRASLSDLLRFGEEVLLKQAALWNPLWEWDGLPTSSGPSEGGHFVAFGDGLYIYPEDISPIRGVRLVGHHGEAYGAYCGLWVAPDHDAVFVHADLGSPPNGPGRVLGPPENTAYAATAFARAGALLNP